MMKTILQLLLLGLMLSGCSSTRIVAPHTDKYQDDTVDVAQVQKLLQGKTVQVTLTDSRVFTGRATSIREDSVLWVNEDKDIHAVSTQSVLRIERVTHFGGAVTGFYVGGLGGAVSGCAITLSRERKEWPGLSLLGATMLGGVLGGAIGALWGGLHGIRQDYQFQEESVEPIMQPPAREGLHSGR